MTPLTGLIVGISDNRGPEQYLRKYHDLINVGANPLMLSPATSKHQLDLYLSQCTPHLLWLNDDQLKLDSPLDQKWQDSTLFFTSGSSGVPRVIVHKNSSLKISASDSLHALGLNNYERLLTPLPMWHVGGLLNYYRAKQLKLSYENLCVKRKDLLTTLRHDKRSLVVLVPAQLSKMIEEINGGKASENLEHVTFYLGGAGISPKLIKDINELKLNVVTSYGMTETAGAIAYAEAFDLPQMKIMAGVQVTTDEADSRISVYCQRLLTGTIKNNNYIPINPNHSHFMTSDFGKLGNDRLIIHGRLDQVFLSGGENINPQLIENEVLKICPHLNAVKVLPYKDEVLENKIVLFMDKYDKNDIDKLLEKLPRPLRPHLYFPWPTYQGIKPARQDFFAIIEKED